MTCIIKSLLIKYILLYRITIAKIFSMPSRTFLTTRQHSEYKTFTINVIQKYANSTNKNVSVIFFILRFDWFPLYLFNNINHQNTDKYKIKNKNMKQFSSPAKREIYMQCLHHKHLWFRLLLQFRRLKFSYSIKISS